MLSENVLLALISAISLVVGAIITGGVAWYVALRKLPHEIKAADSQEVENLANALNSATAGLANYASASAKKEESWITEREYMMKEIDELKVHKDERSRMIFEIQQKMERTEREYVIQLAALNSMIERLQKQVDEGNGKYESLKRQTLKMYKALKDNNIEIDIDPDFRDTLERMKAVK